MNTPPSLPDDRWRAPELVFWCLPLVAWFAFPGYLVLGSQILITGLFAVSLDLVLGYAGIVSLGHAAFFGLGAYTAGLLAVHGWSEPLSGLLAGAAYPAAECRVCHGYLLLRFSRPGCAAGPRSRLPSSRPGAPSGAPS